MKNASYNWIDKTLGEFCTFTTGGTPASGVAEYYENGNIPWLVSGDIHKGVITNSDKFITKKALNESNARYLPQNSVLIALNGQGKTRGTVAMLKMKNATCNQSLVAIYPDEHIAIPEYIYYSLRFKYSQIRMMTGDNERSGLSISVLKRINIMLPPIEEQCRIVTKIESQLAAVDKAKRVAEEQLAIAGALKNAYLREVFDKNEWEKVELGKLCFVTKLAGFEYTEYVFPKLCDKGIPLFKGKNIQGDNIIYQFESFIPEDVSDSLKRSQVNKKCLLIPYVGSIGSIGLHDKQGKYHLGSNVGKVEIIEKRRLCEEYLLFFLRSRVGFSEITKTKKATAQDSISIDAIRKIIIHLPPLDEQHYIVKKLKARFIGTEKTIAAVQTQLDAIAAIPTATLRKYLENKGEKSGSVPKSM